MKPRQQPFTVGRTWRNWKAFAALRKLSGLRPASVVIPSPSLQLIGANRAQPLTLTVAPGSYIVGFAGTSSQPEGFSFKITDNGTACPFFSSYINFGSITQPAPQFGITSPVVLLAAPRLILAPGTLGVTIRNLSPNANTIEMVVFIAEPNNE